MDALGIIRQMQGDAALRAQLRAVLLGDDVLELPSTLRELVTAQSRTEARVEELAVAQLRTEVRLEELVTAQSRLEARVEELAVAQSRTEEALRQFIEATRVWQQATDDRLGELRGSSLQIRVDLTPRRYVPRALARRPRPLDDDRLDALLARLDPAVAADVQRADAFVEALSPTGEPMLFVVEAAWTAHVDDVERAGRRADALRRAGEQVGALVVSQVAPAEVVIAAAATNGVALVSESAGLLTDVA